MTGRNSHNRNLQDLKARLDALVSTRQGKPAEVLGEIEDLLAGMQAQQVELEQEKARLEEQRSMLDRQQRQLFGTYASGEPAVFNLDGSEVIVSCSARAGSLLDQAQAVLTGRLLSDYLAQDGRESFRTCLQQARQSGEVETCQVCLGVDGAARTVEARILATGSQGWRVVCLERDQVIQNVAGVLTGDWGNWANMLVENSQDGLSLFDLKSGRYVFMNSSLLAMTGFSAAELSEFGPEQFLGRVYPDDVETVRSQRAFAIAGEELPAPLEYRWRVQSGEYRWFRKINRLVCDVQGVQLAIVEIFRDITDRKQFENELAQYAERLELSSRSAHMGIWDWNIEKNELIWDDQINSLYGLQPGQFGGAYQAWLQGVHPQDREASNLIVERAVRGEIEFDTEFRVLWPDKSVHWLKANGQVFYGADGKPVRMVGVNYDINECKLAETKLSEVNERFNLLANNISDFFWIMDPKNHAILYISPIFKEITGLSPTQLGELPGGYLDILLSEDQHILHEARAVQARGLITEVKYRIRRVDGRVRWLVDKGFPIFDGTGKVERVVGIAHDMTGQMESDLRLRQSEERFGKFFESSTANLLVIEPDSGAIVDANPAAARFYGYSLEQFMGMNISDINQLSPEEVREERLRAKQQERNFFIFPHRLADWRVRQVEVHSHPIQISERVLLFSMIYDITERQQAEESLLLEKLKLEKIAITVPGVICSIRWNPQGVIGMPYASPAILDELELDPQDVASDWTAFIARIHPADWGMFFETFHQSAERMTGWNTEFRYRRVSNRIVWLQGQFLPIRERDGSLVWHGFITDISERKRTEQLVYAQRDLALAIGRVGSTEEGFQLCLSMAMGTSAADCGGIYLLEAGQPQLELIHHHGLSQAFVEQVKIIPLDSPGVRRMMIGKTYSIPLEELMNDDLYVSEGLRSLSVIPIINQNNVIGCLNLGSHSLNESIDITSNLLEMVAIEIGNFIVYMRSQLALRRSEKILSRAQTIAHMGSWVAHLQTEKMEWSAETYRIYDYPEGTAVDLPAFYERVHPNDLADLKSSLMVGFQLGIIDHEHRIILPGGEVRWVHQLAEVTFGVEGQPVTVTGSSQDITARKLQERFTLARLRLANLSAEDVDLQALICGLLGEMEDLSDSAVACFQFFQDGQAVPGRPTWFGQGMDMVSAADENAAGDWDGNWWNKLAPGGESWLCNDFVSMAGMERLPGCPVRVQRTLAITVHRLDQVVACMLLVNKPSDYNQRDLETARLLANESFDLILRKHAEEALRQSEEKYRRLAAELETRVQERSAEIQDLYDNAPTGQHSVDGNGNILLINKTHLNWLGYSREEVLNRPLSSFMAAGSRERLLAVFPEFKQSGWVRNLEFEFQRKDGSTFPVLVNATALYDEHGQFLMSRSIVFDNTELKKIENALRGSEETYRALFESANDAIFLLDIETLKYVRVNPRCPELLGVASAEELIGSDSMKFLSRGEIQEGKQKLQQVMAGERVPPYERTFVRQDGTIVETEINLSLVCDNHGNPNYIQSVVRDITLRKKAEQAIRESEAQLRLSRDNLSQANETLEKAARLKDEFLASMSHELRTPLTGILGLSEALQSQIYGDMNDRQLRALNHIENSGRHLLELINDILDLSKIEAGKYDLQVERCSLRDVCLSSVQLTKGMANKKQQQVGFSMTPDTILIYADARRLKQVLVNLLSNAIKFTPQGGALGLEVRLDKEMGQVILAVWDKGIGIAHEDMERLFQPFVQLDSHLAREHAGTGLGLSLVHKLVEMHGGSVELESTLGEGSRFSITLPLTNPSLGENSFNKGDAQLDVPALNGYGPTLDIDSLVKLIRGKGIVEWVSGSGQAALESAAASSPDLILLDPDVADMPGYEVLARLKADERTHSIPVLVCADGGLPGATDWIAKPLVLDELEKKLRILPAIKSVLIVSPAALVPLVMVVDDHEVNLETTAAILKARNFRVALAHSGMELLSMVPVVRPDIILMDIQMPGMDGLEATRRVRSHPDAEIAQLPILALTALTMPGDRERCLRAGVNDYLSKPTNSKQLEAAILRLLQ